MSGAYQHDSGPTPGPWRAVRNRDDAEPGMQVYAGREAIATFHYGFKDVDHRAATANATVAAAAPELAEACEAFVKAFDSHSIKRARALAEAALARARGAT